MVSETRHITQRQSNKRVRPGDMIVWFAGLYGLVLTGFLILREVVGEQWTPVALFNSVAHLLLPLALIGVVICLLARRVTPALLLAPPVIVFGLSYGALFLPRPAIASTTADLRLELLTYNLYSKRADPAQLVDVITEVNAGIVLVQELGVEMADYLKTALAEAYPYQALHPDPLNKMGMGVFSRYPIEADDYWRIHRAHQRVTITLDGETITIYNSRPIFPVGHGSFDYQREEVMAVLERANQENGPVILAGDFNMSDQSEGYRRITETFTDAFFEAGWGFGFTFPAGNPDIDALPERIRRLLVIPLVRLDYVFHNDDLQTLEARAWPDSGSSDHLPLYAVLALAEESPQTLE